MEESPNADKELVAAFISSPHSSVTFVVDEMQDEINAQKEQLQEKDVALQEKDVALKEKDAEIERLRALLGERK